MRSDPTLEQLCDELMSAHAVHTILLYGSRADGSATVDSDYDVAAFGPTDKAFRVARTVGATYLDVFVYPESVLIAPTEDHLKLRGSHVIVQRGVEAAEFLATLDELFQLGAKPLPADENAVIRVWAHKMLARIKRSDAEGNYRRVWLLTALLEDYFLIRGLWYQGPKKALRWLEEFDVPTHNAMLHALEPNASHEAISSLVHLVAGDPDA
jgi:hypothetical protein